MANQDERTDLLQVQNDAGVIANEEMLLLDDLNLLRNPKFLYWRYEKLDLERLEGDECKAELRMKRGGFFSRMALSRADV